MRGKVSTSRIGVDLMGSDTAPELLLEAALSLFHELKSRIKLTILGTKSVLQTSSLDSGVTFVPVEEVVGMEDDPLIAVRRKKNSSLCMGMRLLQKGELDAFVSAGNTGALMASAKMCLPMLPDIARPALLTLLPAKHKMIAVLDVGANVHFKADHLVQFASMGVAYQKSRGVERPTIGLLNIGSEEKKGTPEVREAYQKLQQLNRDCPSDSPVFFGNVEGRDVFQGKVDVLVTDGFTGNVFLKTAEGISLFILEQLQEMSAEEGSPHLKALISRLHSRLHYGEYPGAILCGIEGIVVKCHGDFSPESLKNSIKAAARLVEHSFLEKIKAQL